MDVQSFSEHLARIRDKHLPMLMSWARRTETTEFISNEDHIFEVCLLSPVHTLTADDLMWALVAAAIQPYSTHVHIRIPDLSTEQSCVHRMIAVLKELQRFAFDPFDYDVFEGARGIYLRVSLFTEDEVHYANPEVHASAP